MQQRFVVDHLTDESFKSAGLRPYNIYRDLGVAAATGGFAEAHVVKAARPCEPGATGGNHYHTVEFQFVYILKGWQRMRVDGVGELTVREGSSWIQPPGIRHEVLEYSDDREALEIILPAKYDTITD